MASAGTPKTSKGFEGTSLPATAQSNGSVALCASCDRCRSRKTKCDGKRPCSNCANRYMKSHGLTSIEGVDLSSFDCVYSPAKRRGPVPGRSMQRRAMSAFEAQLAGGSPFGAAQQVQLMLMQQQLAAAGMMNFGGLGMNSMGINGIGMNSMGMNSMGMNSMGINAMGINAMGIDGIGMNGMGMMDTQTNPLFSLGPDIMPGNKLGTIDDPISLQRHLIFQQQIEQMGIVDDSADQNQTVGGQFSSCGMGPAQQINLPQQPQEQASCSDRNQRPKLDTYIVSDKTEMPSTVSKHLALLNKSNGDGNRFRSYYDLSIDQLLRLPPIPTNDEYVNLVRSSSDSDCPPKYDLAALDAARFSEIALGALANNQIGIALELSNATVLCLRMCVEKPVHPSCIFEIARAYLLHGLFRSYRSDMIRYFKYRRVCLAHLSKLDNDKRVETLLAAMSFHDSWAYMIYNASEEKLPLIDDIIPPVASQSHAHDNLREEEKSSVEAKYGISTTPSKIAKNPINQMWIQGPPPVFINNEASAISRSLDALACAIRSCCDQANERFEGMAKEMNDSNRLPPNNQNHTCGDSNFLSPTGHAVLANQNELCSRNMVVSAFSLLQRHEASPSIITKNHGHHLIVSAMDAFLEGGDDNEPGGFTDSQIHSLLSVCNIAVEHPLLLYQPGITYHMVTNAAILLCHLLNGMYASGVASDGAKPAPAGAESALFDEVLDTYIAVRKLLNIHRRKLPIRLRCHGIPRPKIMGQNGSSSASSPFPAASFIDLGETLMCGSRGCQGFVLMACSPCVAAERAQAAAVKAEEEAARAENMEREAMEENGLDDFDRELQDLDAEFDVDDDALLSVLSRIVSS